MSTGLKDTKLPAVYAVLDKMYKRGSDGWDRVKHVGITQDLASSLQSHYDHHGDKVAHIRALSFSFPEPNAMQQVATDWRDIAKAAGAELETSWSNDILEYLHDDDDDDDDDEFDDFYDLEGSVSPLAASTLVSESQVISPFLSESAVPSSETESSELELNPTNVDKVLDEVRPYLIADGGNVSVERVDVASKNVYLKLEGACGSCESSTVTMQMGIERVLREKFSDLNEVLRAQDDPASKPTKLSQNDVENEINRLKSAIIAMGGYVELSSVDSELGVVEVIFRGANKVRSGLELALLDVPFVKHVKFVSTE